MKRSIVFACAFTLLLWAAPSALADPTTVERDLSGSDGSNFTGTFNGNGIPNTYSIAPGATGPAADADRFIWHEAYRTDSNGNVVDRICCASTAESSVGRHHELVTVSFPGQLPGFTLHNVGFYVPAGPDK